MLAKTFARTFALPLASRIQCPSAFKGGMLQDFDFLCSNSLFRRHQSLECRGKPRMRSRRLCLYATNAPCSTSLQARDSSANSRVPAAAVFAATAAKHVASSQGLSFAECCCCISPVWLHKNDGLRLQGPDRRAALSNSSLKHFDVDSPSQLCSFARLCVAFLQSMKR